MSSSSEQTVGVKIYNQTYYVRSGGDAEYIRRLADFVDQRMREVFDQTPTVDTLKVAILAALTLADELLTARSNVEALNQEVSEGSTRMLELLEPLLQSNRRAQSLTE